MPSAGSEARQASTEESALGETPAASDDSGGGEAVLSQQPDTSEVPSSTASVPHNEHPTATTLPGSVDTHSGEQHSDASGNLMSIQASTDQEEEEEGQPDPHVAALNALSLLVEQANATVSAAPEFAANPAVVVRRPPPPRHA